MEVLGILGFGLGVLAAVWYLDRLVRQAQRDPNRKYGGSGGDGPGCDYWLGG